MKYITGIHALNLPCNLITDGDWHCSALRWKDIMFNNTEDSFFKDYGIEYGKHIPNHEDTFAVANHIRALLDLLEMGNFSVAQGMNKDFIGNDYYNDEILSKVASMKVLPNWLEIDQFMGKEYYGKWLSYKGEINI